MIESNHRMIRVEPFDCLGSKATEDAIENLGLGDFKVRFHHCKSIETCLHVCTQLHVGISTSLLLTSAIHFFYR